ncbi:putative metalloprotease CJM1_0395 family protein [Halomonadaceae bacterium KBTZ08]
MPRPLSSSADGSLVASTQSVSTTPVPKPDPTAPRSQDSEGGAGVQVSISGQGRQQSPQQQSSNPSSEGNSAGSQRPESARSGNQQERGQEASQGNREDPEQGSERPTPEEDSVIQELRGRDREVRQHEQAHQVVGGQYAGAPTYTYQRGPEGQLYAVGGQVSIDTSPVRDDPRATISKMRTVRSAALAPADPSPQDLRVAQEATRQLLQAQSELRSSSQKEGDDGPGPTGETQASASGRSGDGDARVNLFRDVDGMPSLDSTDPLNAEPRFSAIA